MWLRIERVRARSSRAKASKSNRCQSEVRRRVDVGKIFPVHLADRRCYEECFSVTKPSSRCVYDFTRFFLSWLRARSDALFPQGKVIESTKEKHPQFVTRATNHGDDATRAVRGESSHARCHSRHRCGCDGVSSGAFRFVRCVDLSFVLDLHSSADDARCLAGHERQD